MRKFLILSMLALGMMLTSCKSEIGLAYNVAVIGDGNGQVEVNFDQGIFAMDGNAAFYLNAKDSVPFYNSKQVTKQYVVENYGKDGVEALDLVQEKMESVSAHSESGTYDIDIDGWVTVYPIGISVKVNKRLTNRDDVQARKNPSLENVRWCYIE